MKQVFVEERRYDTLDESVSEGDAPKMPATLPGNPSAEGAELDPLMADIDILDISVPEPTFTSAGDLLLAMVLSQNAQRSCLFGCGGLHLLCMSRREGSCRYVRL